MADSLLIRNSALAATPGGGLVTTAGGAPCCCGKTPGEPCGQNVGQPCPCGTCRSTSHAAYLRTWVNRILVPVWSRPVTCCCNTFALRRYYTRTEMWRYATFPDPTPFASCDGDRYIVTYQISECAGQGSGLQAGPLVTNARRIRYDLNGNVTRDYTCTSAGETAGCFEFALPEDCFGSQDPFDPGIQGFAHIQTIRLSGFIFEDCTSRVTDVWDCDQYRHVSSNELVYRLTHTKRFETYDPNTAACSPGCDRGACCCDGICYGNVSAAECAAMRGQFFGPGSVCIDVECQPGPEPPVIVNPGATVSTGGIEMFGALPRIGGGL